MQLAPGLATVARGTRCAPSEVALKLGPIRNLHELSACLSVCLLGPLNLAAELACKPHPVESRSSKRIEWLSLTDLCASGPVGAVLPRRTWSYCYCSELAFRFNSIWLECPREFKCVFSSSFIWPFSSALETLPVQLI